MITDLRNPSLKQRHWESIEGILEYHFTPEDPITLGKLTDIGAFKHGEALQEVSGRASSEASLESILKKVGNDTCILYNAIYSPNLYFALSTRKSASLATTVV